MPVTPPPPRPTNSTTRIVHRKSADLPESETDYVLSDSAMLPAIRFIDDAPNPVPTTSAGKLDPETQALFHQRLRICCLVAALPFFVFFLASLTGFIELFARPVVGLTGVFLSGAVFALLSAVAVSLWRIASVPEVGLRVLEIAVFGAMGVCFAYWSFCSSRPISSGPIPRSTRRPSSGSNGTRSSRPL